MYYFSIQFARRDLMRHRKMMMMAPANPREMQLNEASLMQDAYLASTTTLMDQQQHHCNQQQENFSMQQYEDKLKYEDQQCYSPNTNKKNVACCATSISKHLEPLPFNYMCPKQQGQQPMYFVQDNKDQSNVRFEVFPCQQQLAP